MTIELTDAGGGIVPATMAEPEWLATDGPPWADDRGWRTGDHWRCTFVHDETGEEWTTDFWMGVGHGGKAPTAEAVMESVVADCAGVDDGEGNFLSFEEWAPDYGYDSDSRRAYAIYEACIEQAKAVRAWLGDDAYMHALWPTER